jgi:hypothetical protein
VVQQVSRRTVVRSSLGAAALAAGGTAVLSGLLSGCEDAEPGAEPSGSGSRSGTGRTSDSGPTQDPAEVAALRAATAQLTVLSARYVAVQKRHPALATRLAGPRKLHDAHLARLRGLGGSVPAPKSAPRAVPPTTAKALAELVTTEQRLATAHAAAAAQRSGQAARVLASIAASQAQIAVALGRKAAG